MSRDSQYIEWQEARIKQLENALGDKKFTARQLRTAYNIGFGLGQDSMEWPVDKEERFKQMKKIMEHPK